MSTVHNGPPVHIPAQLPPTSLLQPALMHRTQHQISAHPMLIKAACAPASTLHLQQDGQQLEDAQGHPSLAEEDASLLPRGCRSAAGSPAQGHSAWLYDAATLWDKVHGIQKFWAQTDLPEAAKADLQLGVQPGASCQLHQATAVVFNDRARTLSFIVNALLLKVRTMVFPMYGTCRWQTGFCGMQEFAA